MAFVGDGDEEKIAAYFGSPAEWEAIRDWSTFWPPRPDRSPTSLDHGYDESKQQSEWSLDDMRDAAEFRGGGVLSEQMRVGDIATPLDWGCAQGHTFSGSPRLVLIGGHCCPECVKNASTYPQQAERNSFLAQVEGATAKQAVWR
jgi:hypothetical protein